MAIEIINGLKKKIRVLIAIIVALSIALAVCNFYYIAHCGNETKTEDAAPADTYSGKIDIKKRFKHG